MSSARATWLVAACAWFAIGCAHRTSVRAHAAAALLDVVCPDEARLYVDGRLEGNGRILRFAPLELAPGAHRLELATEGHFTMYRDLTVARGERKNITLTPQKIPDGYQGW